MSVIILDSFFLHSALAMNWMVGDYNS